MSNFHEMHARQARDEIVKLNTQLADEQRKSAAAVEAAARLRAEAARATSPASARSKQRQAESKERNMIQAQKRAAGLQDKISKVTKKLHDAEAKLTKEHDDKARKLERELRDASQLRRRAVQSEYGPVQTTERPSATPEYDLFLAHASLDKEAVVRPIASALEVRGVSFFFDEISIGWGDSIRQKIDRALAKSRFGLVVLSPAFLTVRPWTERELNALFAKEDATGRKVILPLWHNVTKAQVAEYSPILADRAALKTSDYTFDEIADEIVKLTRPLDGG